MYKLLSILILTFCSLHFNENPSVVLYSANLEASERQGTIKRRKKYIPIGLFEAWAHIYRQTLKLHCSRGILSSYLILCTSAGERAFVVGMAIFFLSSLSTWATMIAGRIKWRWCKWILILYVRVFDWAYRCLVWILAGVVGLFCIAEISKLIGVLEYLDRMSPVIACFWYGSIWPLREEAFEVNFAWQDQLKIEESRKYYRISIGALSWLVSKDNVFMRLVFSVLIYSALKRRGRHQVLDVQTLARALGWENSTLFYHMFVKYQRAGNDLRAIIADALSAHIREIRKQAMEVWLQDMGQSEEEVKKRLQGRGLNVSIEKIKEAVSLVNFNTLRKSLYLQYCRRADYDWDSARILEIREQGESYVIKLGNLYWQIEKQDRFSWISLVYWLHEARNSEGKRLFPLRGLKASILNSHQHLHQLFDKYRIIAQKYQDMQWVGGKRENNEKLTEIIVDMWIEDFTLSADKIAERLIERGHTQSITGSTVRNLVNSVDFIKIRRRIARDYKQGRYSKSSEWVMSKYQCIISELLQQLAHGRKWSKAQIEMYITDLPATLPTNQIQPNEPVPSHLAWLKCFLFNLPKSQNGKICCPQCGSFATSNKSAKPEAHSVIDPRSGHNIQVHSLRFYCDNPHCSTKTFTTSPDGLHTIDENRFAKACLMLRLVMDLGGSYRSVARILGVRASTVFDQLTLLSYCIHYWEEILGVTRFSGTLCIDEKFVKIAELKNNNGKRPFAYLFFAVDPHTTDLLHIAIYPSRKQESVEAFLVEIKVHGISPRVIMTDLMGGYDTAIKNVFGRTVTICKCHFHFKMNIFKHMHDQFGKNNVPNLAEQLKSDIFMVVDYNSKKSIHYWFGELMRLKPRYLEHEPRLEPMFKCLESYLPDLLRIIENDKVTIMTNNAAEQAIRHFNQRYKVMGGFKSFESAQRHARLFQLVYRFTPLSEDAQESRRGKSPLELAGYRIAHMPIYQYLTEPLLFNLQPAHSLTLCQEQRA